MPADPESPDQGTPELNALNSVVRALRGLPPELRRRVIDSAMVLLGGNGLGSSPQPSALSPALVQSETIDVLAATDIRRLKEQKKPESAIEMAALIAYYLGELVTG